SRDQVRGRAGDLRSQQSRDHRLDGGGGGIGYAAGACGDLHNRESDRRSSRELMPGRRQLRITIWNEHVHELRDDSVKRIYPDGMHRPIADGIRRDLGADLTIGAATRDEPEPGLPEEVVART